jgi:outer membrane protein OmpA-like peptidoglycan-associated protein
MKRLVFVTLVLVGAALVMTGCLQGQKQPRPTKMDTLGWWPTKAEQPPKPDPRPDMAGEWWWPTDRAQEHDPLWGNRGFVYVLRRTGREAVDGGKVTLPRGLKEVEALVFEDVHFEFDKSEITPTGKKILDGVVAKLKEYPGATVTLEGHTCSIGTEEYNKGLGERRAKAVFDYLVSQGIAPERLSAISYGETRLKYYNPATGVEASRDDYQRNRRVEFKVTMPEEIE